MRLAARPGAAVLESTSRHETYGRYSILAAEPVRTLRLEDGRLIDERGRCLAADPDHLWAILDGLLGPAGGDGGPFAYGPGWIGYLGYELGRQIERLPGAAPRDTALPDLHLALYDAVAVFDALEGRWALRHLDDIQAAARADALETLLREPGATAAPRPAAGRIAEAEPNFAPDAYRRAVQRGIDYIAAGDIFQVNLSQRLRVDDPPPPGRIYAALRARNPAWHAACLHVSTPQGPHVLCSASPELFLRVRGGTVLTRPIKGTRPRTGRADVDERHARQLLDSAKDNAELAMIIDLLRNDLGRVCRYNSVRVTQPRVLEAHPTVFHLVGTVEGALREGVTHAGLLRATFPGGSITGAPKIRAMEIIDEIEPVARGPYTGCIGYVGLDGAAEWNIAIRTVICTPEAAVVAVGGGIVADSDPEDERLETLTKARALLEAIEMARDEETAS